MPSQGPDGSHLVFERLEPQDVQRKLKQGRQQQQQQCANSGQREGLAGSMGALQRVMQAWTEDDQVIIGFVVLLACRSA